MTKQFDRNLELFAKERPVEAMRLQYSTQALPKWETKENLKMPWGLLYDADGHQEAKEWFSGLPLKHAKVLYVYGVGLGFYYQPLEQWLFEDAMRHLIFIEDDFAVLHRFLETPLAEKILNNHQVSIAYMGSVEDSEGVLETLYWSTVLAPICISALKSYEKNKASIFEELSYKISYDSAMKNALVDEYLRYGAAFFRNFYPNILDLSGAFWGNGLFGKFQGIPAIICGAGPSLEKQIKTLGSLKEHALIFAGGSSLNGLLLHGVLPHFGAGIDPNPTQLERLETSQAAKVPFFFRTRMLAEALKMVKGERLYISGAGGYDIADYYEEKFGLASEFLDEGHNVVNFCTEIAVRMGCNPIIYVGMDLAFTGMKAYSKGIDAHDDVSEEALCNPDDEEFRGIQREDIYGKPTYTLWKWIAESDWLSRFAKEHPNVSFINATEGGIGFQDIPNIPLAEVELKKKYPLKDKVDEEIKKTALPQVSSEALKEATLEFRASLQKCLSLIHILSEEIEKEKTRTGSRGQLISPESAFAESELFEEPGYRYLLDIFHQVFVRVQNRRALAIRFNKDQSDDQALAIKKLELQGEKLLFLQQVAEANITLIDYALAAKPIP